MNSLVIKRAVNNLEMCRDSGPFFSPRALSDQTDQVPGRVVSRAIDIGGPVAEYKKKKENRVRSDLGI